MLLRARPTRGSEWAATDGAAEIQRAPLSRRSVPAGTRALAGGGHPRRHRNASVIRRCDLDFRLFGADNKGMVVAGRVQNGVVVLDGDVALPEGARVTVSCADLPGRTSAESFVRFPLVPSERPGSLPLTSDRIAELLDDEDVSA